MEYISHPLIKEGTVEARVYQQVIVANATEKNTMVIAPTGLGKTIIAILLAAHRLHLFPESKVLMLTPTKPLANQHAETFKRILKIEENRILSLTSAIPPDYRKRYWNYAKVIVATPQTIENDLIAGRYNLREVSLLIFDEAHRAVGNYSYVYIAKQYVKQALNPLILAITASPGYNEERILEVCRNLFIQNIEIRTENDPDVKPYIKEVKIEWIEVDLPEVYKKIKKNLDLALKLRIKELKNWNINVETLSKKELLKIRENILEKISKDKNFNGYDALIKILECIYLLHSIELLETQGIKPMYKFLSNLSLKKSKVSKSLFSDNLVREAFELSAKNTNISHPKIDKLKEILKKEIEKNSKVLIFAQYRETVRKIYEEISNIEGVRAQIFIGQSSRNEDKGMSQKKQLETLQKFRVGLFNVLVATSIAEEGLDIPRVDTVIFYEPIPSEIRTIQRRGRTGRRERGRVVILIAKNTRDEIYYWSSYWKEKKMKNVLKNLSKILDEKRIEIKVPKIRIEESFPKYKIRVDYREMKSDVVRHLSEMGVILEPLKLEIGDYLISDEICIERKSVEDFLSSIIDGRLFEQAKNLRESYRKPIIIIEGENIYSLRNINADAIRGAILSLIVDFNIPIIFTKDELETSQFIYQLIKREYMENKPPRIVPKKPLEFKEIQERIVASLPNINTVLAKRLLRKFKTIERIFTAKESELMNVEGIGEKIAKEIRKIITKEYKD